MALVSIEIAGRNFLFPKKATKIKPLELGLGISSRRHWLRSLGTSMFVTPLLEGRTALLLILAYTITCESPPYCVPPILLQSHRLNTLTDYVVKNRIWECHFEKNKVRALVIDPSSMHSLYSSLCWRWYPLINSSQRSFFFLHRALYNWVIKHIVTC